MVQQWRTFMTTQVVLISLDPLVVQFSCQTFGGIDIEAFEPIR